MVALNDKLRKFWDKSGDFIIMVTLVALVFFLSYGTLVAFVTPFAVGGNPLYAHALALAVDLSWIYSLSFLARGRAVTTRQKVTARIVLYGALGVSVFAAAYFGFTVFGVVAAIAYAIPALLVLGIEVLITSTYVTGKRVVTVNTFGNAVTEDTKTVDDSLVEIANDIIEGMKSSGSKRPGWNSVATRYDLRQVDARKVVSLVKEATDD